MKKCRDCDTEKDESEFHKDNSTKDGLSCRCKSCNSSKYKKYRELNKDRLMAQAKAYRESHREEAKASGKKWRESNKARISDPTYKKARLEKQREWRRKNPEKVKNTILKHEHGITLSLFMEALEKQEGCCAICHKHQDDLGKSLNVDHDHVTGQFRGLLCGNCNRAIGLLFDSIENLNSAVVYLSKHKQGLVM